MQITQICLEGESPTLKSHILGYSFTAFSYHFDILYKKVWPVSQ